MQRGCRSPKRQSINRCLQKKEATTIERAVVHEPSGTQFAHACIHQRIPCFLLATSESFAIMSPWNLVTFRSEAICHAVGEGVHDGLVEILAKINSVSHLSLCLNPKRAASRMLMVPNLRCTLIREVPGLAGTSRMSA